MKLEDSATPWGLVAKSFFNDTFELYRKTGEGPNDVGKIDIEEKHIAWSSNLDFKLNNI